MYTAKTSWKGPRWAKVENYIKALAFELDLECETFIDKGFIREYGVVRVKGAKEDCDDFIDTFHKAMDAYNRYGMI